MPPPRGGGAFLANLGDNYALFEPSAKGQNATQNLTAEEQIAAEMQADLLAGTLELDPENDPVLGTTESGIEIKFHGKALTGNWNYTTFMTNYLDPTSSAYKSGTFYNLSGYLYITLGGYNWVIIGRNPNLNTISFTNTYSQGTTSPPEFVKFASYNSYANTLKGQTETTTDAGSAINSANAKGTVNTVSGATRNYSVTLSSYGAPVANSEIASGCVLCICSGVTGQSAFNDSTNVSDTTEWTYYPDSLLDKAMTSIYNKIKAEAGGKIQLTSLKNHYTHTSNYTRTTYTHSDYLFPLSTNGIYTDSSVTTNFCFETYLNSDAKASIDSAWWLRLGTAGRYQKVRYVLSSGALEEHTPFGYGSSANTSYGVRPAFVLKIT